MGLIDEVSSVSIRRIVAPSVEPVTLAEFKTHVHEDLSDATNDTYMTSLLLAAREWCEQYTKRSFITQSWSMQMQALPASDRIYLPRGPIQLGGSLAIITVQTNGVGSVFSSSKYNLEQLTNSLRLIPPNDWPTYDTGYPWPVKITYTAGYGAAASAVPETIKLAIKHLASFWYEFRHGALDSRSKESPPEQVKRLLSGYRLPEFA
ncbi:hypothetical protein EBZ39_03670 [bacterium]|nr:hypothetical protein [bacterium]